MLSQFTIWILFLRGQLERHDVYIKRMVNIESQKIFNYVVDFE